VAVSLDGRRAMSIKSLSTAPRSLSNRDAFVYDAEVLLQPSADPVAAEIIVSGTFAAVWNHPRQTLGWRVPLADALPALALLGFGELLDGTDGLTPQGDQAQALGVLIGSNTFDVFERDSLTDDQIDRFLQGHCYWSQRFGVDPIRFSEAEAVRLGISPEELARRIFAYEGELWERRDDGSLRPLPILIRRFEAQVLRPRRMPTAPSEPDEDSGWEYAVALSFAGEQREYAREVAIRLRDAGVKVFFDEFEESALWGRDLSVSLGEVYSHRSRYVVILVSDEYLAKAWPNHERQHALSGRIRRMDDSVLPVVFADVQLPGLPGSISYLDGRFLAPEALVDRILRKLEADQAMDDSTSDN
jgi:hypothetical protein